MACCIRNGAGHDEELHGEEGKEIEILELRERVLTLESGIRDAMDRLAFESKARARLKHALERK